MNSPSLYWRRKLNAFLHDSPDKAASILGHEDRAAMLKALDSFSKDERFDNRADWRASAADRLPFPAPSHLRQDFADLDAFRHPLGGASLPKGANFASTDQAFEVSQKTRPFLLNCEDPRSAFICAWRFWRNWASSADARFAFLPADTRIPDHTIWHHIGVTSAFQGALPSPEVVAAHPQEDLRPRLLLFSLGPVQDFIAAARSTRDLWSGSYLLSWLVSTALGSIARTLGPDHVLFPSLIDQPLIDHQLSEEIFEGVSFSGKSISDSLAYRSENLAKLLTPSLPNRFLALLPARLPGTDETTEEYAASLAENLRDDLSDIAAAVKSFLLDHPSPHVEFHPETFDSQVGKLLEIHWQTLPVPETLDELIGAATAWESLLPPENEEAGYTPRKPVEAILDMVELTKEFRDSRYFGSGGKLKESSIGWGLLNALVGWLHDGTKSLRAFDGWREGRWSSGKHFSKDALNGKEEAVAYVTGNPEGVQQYCAKDLGMSRGTLKSGEQLGASTLIKRFWHEVWLVRNDVLGITSQQLRKAMPMPNTRSIAAGEPFAQDYDGTDEPDAIEDSNNQDNYFAILALDGDEMGKWISGSKSPSLGECLSPEATRFYQKHAPSCLKEPRSLTPSWHLQFSESLGNFSLHAVQRVVEAFNGRLIYAGGDDVLAMLPAAVALPCARALRAAFRGEPALNELARGVLAGSGDKRHSDCATPLFQIEHPGFLRLHPRSGASHGEHAKLLSDPVDFPALVPGLAADVSVGIAIAHFKTPLQDVVRAAQSAEKRAKSELGRAAFAITLFKRSGETLEWGCKWAAKGEHVSASDSAGYRLHTALLQHLAPGGNLNSRFPHKLEALLDVYRSSSNSITTDPTFEENFAEVLGLELDHCLSRNAGGRLADHDRQLFLDYWNETAGAPLDQRLRSLINLLRVAAWSRPRNSDATEPQPA